MRLVFLGDISATEPYAKDGDEFRYLHKSDLVIANLEGPIVSSADLDFINQRKIRLLYNTLDVLSVLKFFEVDAVCLANNHLYDWPRAVKYTKDSLRRLEIDYFGAGKDLPEASRPSSFSDNETTVKVFGFGWEVIGCKRAFKKKFGVNPFVPDHTISTIRWLRRHDPASFVVFVFHWNYELECYPQPAHRQLAHDLIREGVDAVVGLHPHVAQGAELFEGKPIVYSLGNWFFPKRKFGHFELNYPPIASRQLALELEIEGRQIRDVCFHWHQFNATKSLIRFDHSESWSGATLRHLTPYVDMSHDEYIRWFEKNRTRKRGLPIYRNYNHTWRNLLKDKYVRTRQSFIEALVHLGIKGGPRE
jgi:hypothetical protein